MLERGKWEEDETTEGLKMMGHKAAVLVACYNPKMFRTSTVASAKGTAQALPAPELCLALGSQVRCLIYAQSHTYRAVWPSRLYSHALVGAMHSI